MPNVTFLQSIIDTQYWLSVIMTKQIELTQGFFATVDDEDFEYLNQWNWQVTKGRATFYAIRTEGTFPFRKTIIMHRVIMNTPIEMETDDKDWNGLNNTRNNLRNCTGVQNKQNGKKYSNNTSGYKGVHWHMGKWQARITVDGKRISLGHFSDIDEAARTYNAWAKQYYGEYASLNDIGGATSQ